MTPRNVRSIKALGGNWRGGKQALQTYVNEATKYKAMLGEARSDASTASARSGQANARVDVLFAAVLQQVK